MKLGGRQLVQKDPFIFLGAIPTREMEQPAEKKKHVTFNLDGKGLLWGGLLNDEALRLNVNSSSHL